MRRLLAFAAVMLFLSAISASAALLEGTVARVDKDKKQILLQTEKGHETVEFSAGTKGADKVKAGDKVKVNYTEKNGKIVADAIDAVEGDDRAQMACQIAEKRRQVIVSRNRFRNRQQRLLPLQQ